ncbi:MAG: phosphodiester glycosidase family protein [Myxococcales bacterium]|nr:phosphodiester glycosidase family protein [Myxococcales bacterium]
MRWSSIATCALVACGRSAAPPAPTTAQDDAAAARAAAPPHTPAAEPAPTPCDGQVRILAPGVTGERHRVAAASALPTVEPCLDVVRVDLARHRVHLIMASRDGAPRPVARWADEVGAVAAINAGMFGDDHRGLGVLRDRGHVDRDRDNPRYGGWLVFDPIAATDPPVRVVGRACPGVDADAVRARYRGAIQSYRLLGCDGAALAWADDKRYSAAAFGVDGAGRLVLLHTRAPFRMGDLAAALADPALALTGALYAEGGPEATLVAGAGPARWVRLGSFETGFWEDDSNHTGWDVPNVLTAIPIVP